MARIFRGHVAKPTTVKATPVTTPKVTPTPPSAEVVSKKQTAQDAAQSRLNKKAVVICMKRFLMSPVRVRAAQLILSRGALTTERLVAMGVGKTQYAVESKLLVPWFSYTPNSGYTLTKLGIESYSRSDSRSQERVVPSPTQW